MAGVGRVRKGLLLGLVAGSVVLTGASAWAWPWSKRPQIPVMPLEDIMRSPDTFHGRTVKFKARFALRGRLFKEFNTRFNRAEHANFAVWAYDAVLWDRSVRRNVLPTLYVNKDQNELLKAYEDLKKYDNVEITGEVMSVYAGMPWILVSKICKLSPCMKKSECGGVRCEGEECGNLWTDPAIARMQRGLELMDRKEYRMAARQFELAAQGGIPVMHHHLLYKELGLANYYLGDWEEAMMHLNYSLELDPENAGLYIKLAEAQLKSGQPEAALASCESSIQLSAGHPLVHAVMGEAYGAMGDFELALEKCDLAASTPGIGAEEKAMAEVHRARVLVDANRFADAVRAYARAIGEGSPLTAAPWLRKEIGQLYESRFDATGRLELLDEAIKEYGNAAVLSENKDFDALLLIARAEIKKARAMKSDSYERAKEMLDRAEQLRPGSAEVKALREAIANPASPLAPEPVLPETMEPMDGTPAAPQASPEASVEEPSVFSSVPPAPQPAPVAYTPKREVASPVEVLEETVETAAVVAEEVESASVVVAEVAVDRGQNRPAAKETAGVDPLEEILRRDPLNEETLKQTRQSVEQDVRALRAIADTVQGTSEAAESDTPAMESTDQPGADAGNAAEAVRLHVNEFSWTGEAPVPPAPSKRVEAWEVEVATGVSAAGSPTVATLPVEDVPVVEEAQPRVASWSDGGVVAAETETVASVTASASLPEPVEILPERGSERLALEELDLEIFSAPDAPAASPAPPAEEIAIPSSVAVAPVENIPLPDAVSSRPQDVLLDDVEILEAETEGPAVPNPVSEDDFVAIPGVVEPLVNEGDGELSAMQGPKVLYRNDVVTLPIATILDEKEEIIRLDLPDPELDSVEVESQPAAPTVYESAQIDKSSKAKSFEGPELEALAPSDLESLPELPRNEVRDLPDWAK